MIPERDQLNQSAIGQYERSLEVLLGFTVYYNLEFTAASGPGFWNPVIAGIWVAGGIAIVVALPGVARRAGTGLLRDDGLSAARGTAGDPLPRSADGQESVVTE